MLVEPGLEQRRDGTREAERNEAGGRGSGLGRSAENLGHFRVGETWNHWGDQDTALGKEMTIGTDALVRDFTIRYLHASHCVQQDAPKETNEILSAWLIPISPA